MPYMISSQSVTDGVSVSLSKSKLVYSKKNVKSKELFGCFDEIFISMVYSSLIFLDN